MAYENKDISELDRAKAWLDMAQAKWRLQTMQHRSRYNPKTGEYRQLPTRIRRFLNGTPVGMKTAVLAILKESAPYRSPVFDCETDEGLVYNPTNTFIRKDGVEHTTGGKDPTYTIIQDLLLDDGNRDAFMFGDESSCAQVGETEYRWDEPAVEDCPDGGQGVSYQVTDISRDRETDLFSYRIRKVQALTVHVAPHVTSCDNRARVVTEVWDNVYGEPGAWRQDPLRGGSAAISVPGPCSQPDGTTVKVDVYRNPDCTYRLTVQTTHAKTDDGVDGSGAQYSVYKDRYKTTDSFKVLNAAVPLPRQGEDYSNGLMTRYTSDRNEDGTWNNSTETEQERQVPSSTTETRITPRGKHVSRTDTNMPSPATGIGTQYGYWKTTKTPGGLYTNEYSEFKKTQNSGLGLTCGDTAFMHTHETQASADSVPGLAHVPVANNGLTTTWTYDTDADGFVVRRERKDQEHTVQYAVRRKTFGFLGTTSGYTHRSVAKAVADSLLGSQLAGTSVEARLTNGKMYDVEVQTFLRLAGQTLGFDCSKTIYQHAHETTTSAAAVGSEAANAGGGHTYRKSYSVDTATGAITCREQDTTEIAVQSSRRSVRVTARGKETRVTSSNVPSAPEDPSLAGETVEWEKTPGGRFNVTLTSTEPAQGPVGKGCAHDEFLHTDETTQTSASAADEHVAAPGGGFYRQRRQQLGDDGLWTVSDTVNAEQTVPSQRVEERVTRTGLVRRVTDMQTSSRGAALSASTANIGREHISEVTRGGLYNVTNVTVTPLDGKIGESCEKTAFLHSHSTDELAGSLSMSHVDDAGDGHYGEESWSLTDGGAWERRETARTELQPSLSIRQYQDAFGETTVTEEFAHASENGSEGKQFVAETEIRSVEATLTNGRMHNVRTTTETPEEVDSGWLHMERSTSTGLAAYHDFIVFRNATLSQVGSWLDHAKGIRYSGTNGSFSSHPNASIAPNRFRLWDGTISVTTTFTPKAWASGGSGTSDNWDETVVVKSVNFVPLSQSKLLKVVTEETHRKGGGVGKDRLRAMLSAGIIKGSQFAFHPGGQTYSYDLITRVTSKGTVIDMPKTADATLWNS